VSEILVEVLRGNKTESVHRGSIAVVNPAGDLVCGVGNPHTAMSMRSCAKPLQAIPVVESGAAQHFGFSERELALFCGSLNGQDFQVQCVRSVLDKIGLGREHLACGVHNPSHRPTAAALRKRGEAPGPMHNNCAGKHAAMLSLCVHNGWPVEGYWELNHPVQQLLLEKISELTRIPNHQVDAAVDGCGVPVFFVPLKNLARAYALLAVSYYQGDDNLSAPQKAIKKLMHAALSHPEMIAGDQRICTDIMRTTRKDMLAKTGAEGGYALTLFTEQWGIGVTIDDGAPRSLGPVIIEILYQLDQLTGEEKRSLEPYHCPPITNHRSEQVGMLRPSFRLV